jgi:DNA gyrase subunit B
MQFFWRGAKNGMSKRKTAQYGNDSITQLKGADRVRKRPGVIFGSMGWTVSAFVFENSIKRDRRSKRGTRRPHYRNRFEDRSIQVEDFGRDVPWIGTIRGRYNWELVFVRCTPRKKSK